MISSSKKVHAPPNGGQPMLLKFMSPVPDGLERSSHVFMTPEETSLCSVVYQFLVVERKTISFMYRTATAATGLTGAAGAQKYMPRK